MAPHQQADESDGVRTDGKSKNKNVLPLGKKNGRGKRLPSLLAAWVCTLFQRLRGGKSPSRYFYGVFVMVYLFLLVAPAKCATFGLFLGDARAPNDMIAPFGV